MVGWLAFGAVASIGLLAIAAEKPATSVIIDRRSRARLTPKARKHTTERPANQVTGLVLHQMGFNRGNNPSKYDKVTAHYVILPNGKIYQLHDHTKRLPASSGLNKNTVSVEFAGNFPARAQATDDRAFFEPEKYGKDQLTPEQIQGGRALVDHLVRTSNITHIYAHRQGGRKRENCPGPDVWREIGAWAVQQYGLQHEGPGWTGFYKDQWNAGYSIPESWWDSPKAEEDALV